MIELAVVAMWVIGLISVVAMYHEKTKNTTLNVVSVILILVITTIIVASLGHS
nr:MAG TPA: hypothetical protein [Caudoviricetes sp.]